MSNIRIKVACVSVQFNAKSGMSPHLSFVIAKKGKEKWSKWLLLHIISVLKYHPYKMIDLFCESYKKFFFYFFIDIPVIIRFLEAKIIYNLELYKSLFFLRNRKNTAKDVCKIQFSNVIATYWLSVCIMNMCKIIC